MSSPESLHVTQVPGDGPPIVFLHGLFGQGRNFGAIAKSLAPEHSALLVDLPNHGRSPWSDRVDYVDMANAVADAVRAASPDAPVIVLGHSMGGKVGMLVALLHPELVSALVVVDIAPDASEGASEFQHLLDSLASLELESIGRRAEADRALAEKIPNRTVRSFLLQNLQRTPEGWRWKANLDVLRRNLKSIGEFPDGLDKNPYTGPVLWIAGGDSSYVQPRHFPTMRALFPAYRKVVIKHAGHWVHSEQPEIFIDVLRQFLRSVER